LLTAGITVASGNLPLMTGEDGRSATFSVALDTQPTADVVVPISSSDQMEGTVSAANLTFTTANWNAPQSVTVNGIDDVAPIVDGAVAYTVVVGPAISGDPQYSGLDPADVSMLNLDNDTPGKAFQLGGSGTEIIRDVKIAPDGSVYLLGRYSGTVDFDLGPGTFNLTELGGDDGFIAKYTPDQELVWARSFGGGDGKERNRMIDFDAAGNAYIGGWTNSSAAEFGTFTLTNQGGNDPYVAKLDPEGNFLWARSWGATGNDHNSGLTVDDNGNVFMGGSFESTVDFDPGPAVLEFTSQGETDGYVLGLDSDGNFVSAVIVSGTDRDVIRRVAVDGIGNVYASGVFNGTAQFGTSDGTTPVFLTSAGSSDNFLMKIGADGNTQWVRHATGASLVDTANIGFDGFGGVYFTGNFFGAIDFGPGTPSLISAGDKDSYITRWDTDGDLVWSRQISGPEKIGINGLRFDVGGNPYFAGFFNGSADFDGGPGTVQRNSMVGEDAFVLQLDAAGDFQAVEQVEVESSGWQTVSIDDVGNVYLTGDFSGTATLPTGEVFTSAGSSDAFLLRLNVAPGVSVSPTSGLVTTEGGSATTFDVVLDIPPTADVTIGLSSSDTGEGAVSPASLTFTPTNWNVPQTVTVTGINDGYIDGDVAYTIVTAAATSADPGYVGLNTSDVEVVNLDDDQPITLFSDSFEVGEWNGLWVEDSQNDWFRSTQRATEGSYSAEVDGRATDATLTMADPIDLTPYGSATLDFSWFIENRLDGGEYLAVDLWNGSSWSEVASLRGNVDQENVWHQTSIDIDGAYLADDFKARFRGKASKSDEDANVDDVQLIATSLAGPPNQVPTITTSAVTTATEDLLYAYDVDASDPDAGDTLTFSLDAAPSGMMVDANTGVIQWTPSNSQVGSNSVTVRVQDAGGLFDTQSFSVTVSNVNDSPTITSTPVTTAIAESLYDYDVDASDPDAGDTLAFSLDVAPAGMMINSVSGAIQWTPTSGQVGMQAVTVRVQDVGGLFDTQDFSIEVAAVNHAPVITSAAVTAAIEDALYSYVVEASDSDPGDTLTFSLDVAPSGMSIDGATGLIQWTPTNGQVGVNSVTVRAIDDAGAFDIQAFSVTVANTNDAPTITSSPIAAATENTTYSYDVQASDPDIGDTLTFSLVVFSSGMSINSGTGMIAWTPGSAQVGTHSVTVRAQDIGGLWDQQEFTITVSAAASTKFYVVDDSIDDTFEYTATGNLEESYNLGAGNNSPRGVAADGTGNTIWVIDNDDYVYVYDTAGTLLRSWKATGMKRPEGIASNGADVWIVDRGDRNNAPVLRYFAGGATRTSDTSETSSFPLVTGNPRGVTTDGTHLWVVDAGTDDVYKYTVGGTLVGSWALDSRNTSPQGITIDPANVNHIWVIDAGDDDIYQYSGAASRVSGSQSADAVYGLAADNTKPKGIADPPPGDVLSSSVGRSAAEDAGRPYVSALKRTVGVDLFGDQETVSRQLTTLPATIGAWFGTVKRDSESELFAGRKTSRTESPFVRIGSSDDVALESADGEFDGWLDVISNDLVGIGRQSR
jgi:Putative Ig domain